MEYFDNEKFEYKALEIKEKGFFVAKLKLEEIENLLNFYGEKGWELASSFTLDLDSNGKKEVILILKRRIS